MTKEQYIKVIKSVIESPRNNLQKITMLQQSFELYVEEHQDLGFTSEEIVCMAKFYKEHTSAEAIAENMRIAGKLMEWVKYKDLEEQERILILPCKIGTPVYTITFYNCLNGKCCWYKNGQCSKEKAHEYCPQEVIEQKYSLTMYRDGDKVFLTREEAEANVGKLRVGG